eukprot:NODE_24717_length_613_cov_4.664609.p1 GENE.NODE_24717_length_613_cov_4.664609~~NODE_24717_length_613_cov_4.664609.p1  ORF type:complete len:163 (+),score=40.68 NODE_24717_length_613_cov_4.664609:28-516(+)
MATENAQELGAGFAAERQGPEEALTVRRDGVGRRVVEAACGSSEAAVDRASLEQLKLRLEATVAEERRQRSQGANVLEERLAGELARGREFQEEEARKVAELDANLTALKVGTNQLLEGVRPRLEALEDAAGRIQTHFTLVGRGLPFVATTAGNAAGADQAT